MTMRPFHAITVRLLGDPAFRDAVYADPDKALATEPISPDERRWFTAVDRRAWDIDPLRNARLLTALLDEYRVTGIALAAHGWTVSRLHGFFSSAPCHTAIATWESLFLAFPLWLRTALHPVRERSVHAVLAIDAAIARVRRAPFDRRPPVRPGHVRLAPSSEPLTLVGGALALWENHHGALAALADGGAGHVARLLGSTSGSRSSSSRMPSFSHTKLRTNTTESVLVTASTDQSPNIAFVGEGLVDLLLFATSEPSHADLVAYAISAGLSSDEAIEIIEELISDGTLLSGG